MAAATQTFVFEPAEAVDMQNAPTFGVFESAFQGVQNVSFKYVPADLVVLLIDHIVGSIQTCYVGLRSMELEWRWFIRRHLLLSHEACI